VIMQMLRKYYLTKLRCDNTTHANINLLAHVIALDTKYNTS